MPVVMNMVIVTLWSLLLAWGRKTRNKIIVMNDDERKQIGQGNC